MKKKSTPLPYSSLSLPVIIVVLFVGVLSLSAGLFFFKTYQKPVQSFEECAKAGYPIMESYPAQCKTPEGKTYTQDIPQDKENFYGTSTNGECAMDTDCKVGGCSQEICQSNDEEDRASICIAPDKPVAGELGYKCGCVEKKCQWSK